MAKMEHQYLIKIIDQWSFEIGSKEKTRSERIEIGQGPQLF